MRDTGSVTKQTVSQTPKSIESSSNHERGEFAAGKNYLY